MKKKILKIEKVGKKDVAIVRTGRGWFGFADYSLRWKNCKGVFSNCFGKVYQNISLGEAFRILKHYHYWEMMKKR